MKICNSVKILKNFIDLCLILRTQGKSKGGSKIFSSDGQLDSTQEIFYKTKVRKIFNQFRDVGSGRT